MLTLAHFGNRLDDIRAVVASGADGIEFDVRSTADGVLVLHHDAEVPGVGLVSGTAKAHLPDWIPDLETVLDLCGHMVVNIEVKNLSIDPDRDPTERTAKAVAALIVERRLHDHVVVSSFSMASLDAVRAADPAIPTARLTLPQGDQLALAQAALDRGHATFHPHAASVTPALVSALHAQDLRVTPWAVDDLPTFQAMEAAGADAVITDTPGLIS